MGSDGGHSPLSDNVPENAPVSLPGLLEVTRADDVVAVEDGPRLVSGNLHGHPFGHAAVDHVPHGRPSEVMPQHSEEARLFAVRLGLHQRGLAPCARLPVESLLWCLAPV